MHERSNTMRSLYFWSTTTATSRRFIAMKLTTLFVAATIPFALAQGTSEPVIIPTFSLSISRPVPSLSFSPILSGTGSASSITPTASSASSLTGSLSSLPVSSSGSGSASSSAAPSTTPNAAPTLAVAKGVAFGAGVVAAMLI
ncbi:hypothetical protein C8F01DRAFT_433970 [Mycena amicta]|nr:hypothetical protein C8F01DRAFT_433970 [Mycena amicta]